MNKFFSKDKVEVGIDEAGRGCLAGPVFTAAVILPKEFDDELHELINQIKDSKKLSRKKRFILRELIENIAIDYSVTFKDNNYIDKHNILKSTQDSMHQSISKLNITPDLLLVDGNYFKPYYNNNELIDNVCIIGGDDKYLPIACASILAKEYHDDYIKNLILKNKNLSIYGWEKNMCYGTAIHINSIKEYGISCYHRKSFGICKDYLNKKLKYT